MRTIGSKLFTTHVLERGRRDPVYLVRLANFLGLPADRLDAVRRGDVVPTPDEAIAIEAATGVPGTSWTRT